MNIGNLVSEINNQVSENMGSDQLKSSDSVNSGSINSDSNVMDSSIIYGRESNTANFYMLYDDEIKNIEKRLEVVEELGKSLKNDTENKSDSLCKSSSALTELKSEYENERDMVRKTIVELAQRQTVLEERDLNVTKISLAYEVKAECHSHGFSKVHKTLKKFERSSSFNQEYQKNSKIINDALMTSDSMYDRNFKRDFLVKDNKNMNSGSSSRSSGGGGGFSIGGFYWWEFESYSRKLVE